MDFFGSYGIGCCCGKNFYHQFRQDAVVKQQQFFDFLSKVDLVTEMTTPYDVITFFRNILRTPSLVFEKPVKKDGLGKKYYSVKALVDEAGSDEGLFISDTDGFLIVPYKVYSIIKNPSYPPKDIQTQDLRRKNEEEIKCFDHLVWLRFERSTKDVFDFESLRENPLNSPGQFVEYVYDAIRLHGDEDFTEVLPNFGFSVEKDNDMCGKFILVILYLCRYAMKDSGQDTLNVFEKVRLQNYLNFVQAAWEIWYKTGAGSIDFVNDRLPVELRRSLKVRVGKKNERKEPESSPEVTTSTTASTTPDE